jgi:hypothetical protein
LVLVSLSCATKSSQLESKILDQYERRSVEKAIGMCKESGIEITDNRCEGLKDDYSKIGRQTGKDILLEANNTCQEHRLSEDDCNKIKEQMLKGISL